MKISIYKFVSTYTLITLSFILLGFTLQAQSTKVSFNENVLKVGIAGSEPFVFSDEQKGIAIEIWKK